MGQHESRTKTGSGIRLQKFLAMSCFALAGLTGVIIAIDDPLKAVGLAQPKAAQGTRTSIAKQGVASTGAKKAVLKRNSSKTQLRRAQAKPRQEVKTREGMERGERMKNVQLTPAERERGKRLAEILLRICETRGSKNPLRDDDYAELEETLTGEREKNIETSNFGGTER